MSEELSLKPRDPYIPITIDKLKSQFGQNYLIHDFNLIANNTVDCWLSRLQSKTPRPLAVNGNCGNGKTHLIFHHLATYKEKNQKVNIYWWSVEHSVNRKIDLERIQRPGIIFYETVLNNDHFKQATDALVNYCIQNNLPLILTDASSENIQKMESVDYVKINEPSKEFYDLFSIQYKKNHPLVKFRDLNHFLSIRQVESELHRDVLAHELGVEIK